MEWIHGLITQRGQMEKTKEENALRGYTERAHRGPTSFQEWLGQYDIVFLNSSKQMTSLEGQCVGKRDHDFVYSQSWKLV